MANVARASYAAALIVAGAAGFWRVSLTSDEALYYKPAIRFFAEQLPHVPLDYPAPSPPLGFVLQAIVFRLTGGSVACVRALATLAAIITVSLVAGALKGYPRGNVVALMIGTFPPMLVYAFSLKQHWLTVLFVISGYLLWERGRDAGAALLLLCAVLTNQIAAAFVVAILARQIVLRRRVVLYLAPLGALAALVAWWQGLQPPMFRGPGPVPQPGLLHLFWPQLLLLLFAAGVWVVPMIAERWRHVAGALVISPLAAFALHQSRIMIVRPDPDTAFYERAIGPLLGLIRLVVGNGVTSLIAVAIAVAIGCSLFALRRDDDIAHTQLYAVTYALVMLPVPFFFESYYAVFVLGSWAILGRRMAGSRSRLLLLVNLGAIVVGIGYAVFRFRVTP